MKKVLSLFLLALLVCFGLVATASADGVDVELVCPTSVTAGNALAVTINLYNWDCANSVSVGRIMKVLGGNSGGTFGTLGLWGPYPQTISPAKVVPAATCDISGTTPGSVAFSRTIINSVPTSLGGTMAMVMVSAVTSTGEMVGGGECMVQVVP